MSKRLILLTGVILFVGLCYGQELIKKAELPVWSIKSNLLYDATSTINLGMEFRLSKKTTLDVSGNFNPWTFNNNKKWKHILVQPELRWWLCESFNGHFFGLHAHYMDYNMGNVDPGDIRLPIGIHLKGLKDYRYRGYLGGGGISYGYQTYLGRRFNLEFSIGVGYAYLNYKQYQCAKCGDLVSKEHKNYLGPTKAAISLVYFLK